MRRQVGTDTKSYQRFFLEPRMAGNQNSYYVKKLGFVYTLNLRVVIMAKMKAANSENYLESDH